MSVSVSSHPTKTLTDSEDSDSTENPFIEDRWTNNISYRQLVISSCIGVFQLCWHPYLFDLRRLLPFLFLNNVFSLIVAYPIFYLELALGVVTKKDVLHCWDLAPMARGVGFAMLGCCMFTALAAGAIGARCLSMLVLSFHIFLPWLHCAAAASPPCAARHRPLPPGAETPAQSFYYKFVLDIKRDGLQSGFGYVVWEQVWYYIICWVLIYFIAIKRVYSYSKLVLFKDVLAFFVLVTCAIGATSLDGAGDVFRKCDWSSLFEGFQIWREAIEYSLVEMAAAQGSLVMFGSQCPKPHKLGRTALLALAASKLTCITASLTLAAAYSALKKDYDDEVVLPSGSATAMILWADYVARVPGSQFWSALVFFSLFVLAVSTAALLVQTVMSTFSSRTLRKVSWTFLMLICWLFCCVGVITLCTQGGQYTLDFLLNWPVSKTRVPIAGVVAFVITFVYGQTAFCEDVFFAIEEYPPVFVRICWAISPVLLSGVFATGIGVWPSMEALAGWLLVAVTLLPIGAEMVLYLIFKCRVRNIVRSGK